MISTISVLLLVVVSIIAWLLIPVCVSYSIFKELAPTQMPRHLEFISIGIESYDEFKAYCVNLYSGAGKSFLGRKWLHKYVTKYVNEHCSKYKALDRLLHENHTHEEVITTAPCFGYDYCKSRYGSNYFPHIWTTPEVKELNEKMYKQTQTCNVCRGIRVFHVPYGN